VRRGRTLIGLYASCVLVFACMGGAAASQADAVVEATPEPDRAGVTLDGVTRLGAAIRNYASAYNKGQVSDEAAKKLINEAIAIEDAEVKLKRSYVPKLEKVLPGIKVARCIQIENKIRAVVRHDLAAQIPLAQ
jgi:hypothetical protein